MARLLSFAKAAGVALIFIAAGASDGGSLGLGATFAMVGAGSALVIFGFAAERVAPALRRAAQRADRGETRGRRRRRAA